MLIIREGEEVVVVLLVFDKYIFVMGSGRSWVLTVFTQLLLLGALLWTIMFMGTKPKMAKRREAHLDIYFLSVSGGERPFKHQRQLLKQMERMAKKYDVQFVVCTTDLGDQDPLLLNATKNFASLGAPWHTTMFSRGKGAGYHVKRISILHDNFLDLIFLDAGLLEDLQERKGQRDFATDQKHRLMKTLAMPKSTWRIVVGTRPLIICEESKDIVAQSTSSTRSLLHPDFLRYEVDAYLSNQNASGHYILNEGIAYIGQPIWTKSRHVVRSDNMNQSCLRESDGFFLHRASSLEIESYFFNALGQVISRHTLHQRGKAVM